MSSSSSKLFSYNKIPNGIEFTVSAPGKVILHGEHSVVYEKLAIAGSLGLRTRIHLVEIDTPDAFVFKIAPLDFEYVFSVQVLEKLLLDKPPALTSEISDYNWECSNLVHRNAQMALIEETLHSILKPMYNGRYKAAIKSVKVLFYFLSGILSSANVKLNSVFISVDSDLDMGAGIGSSASFCVALAATIIQYLKLKTLGLSNSSRDAFKPFSWTAEEIEYKKTFSERQLEDISNWAYSGERTFHGMPSGLDNTICTYGNMVKFRKNHKPVILKLSNTIFDVLLINTRVSRETSRLVGHVAKLREMFPALVNHILEAMEDLTTRAADTIANIDNGTNNNQSNSFHDLETLVQMNHGLLCALGVSHQKLEEVVMILEKHGLKGKLTGAGGGGFAIALVPPDYDPEEVMRKLKERDFGVICTKLGGEGVKIGHFRRSAHKETISKLRKSMAREEEYDKLPDKDAAKEFYAKYEPKELLGRGISSTVRRCIEKETGREYAAKIIDLSNDDATLEGTKQEVTILRTVVGHPYIIELQDVFESSTFIFLVFELCKHGELFDYLTSVVTLSEKKTRYIMRQVFEGVQHIHSRGVVHRDLKPENILLDDNLNVKITDFGFARKLEKGEMLNDLCGTPGYLAPETLKTNMFDDAPGYSFEVDIWACGVIMYTLLVGCPPFWHRKQMVMLRNIMEGKYSFSSPEWTDISESPKDLIRKLLVVDPKQRISIQDALKHEFFQSVKLQTSKFNARRKFKMAILFVRAMVRIQRLRFTPEPLSVDTARTDPYRIKLLRKIVDGCAFRVYGHWVKKGEGQNRAALFENAPKTDLKHIYLANLSR